MKLRFLKYIIYIMGHYGKARRYATSPQKAVDSFKLHPITNYILCFAMALTT